MSHSASFTMALTSVCLMLIAAGLSYFDGTLFPKQMMMKYPGYSFSFLANGAMAGNLVIMSLVLYIIGSYWDQWHPMNMLGALILGLAMSYCLFKYIYLPGKIPDALAGGGRPISPAGLVVMVYGGLAYAAILLFYLRADAAAVDVVIVGLLLALYIPIANHAVLGYLNSLYNFPWCPRIFVEESSPLRFIIGGEILVIVATIIKLLK